MQTRLLGALLAVTMIGGMSPSVNAQTPAPYVRVFIDGQPVAFDVPPVIASGRVLVSLRGVFQRLGAIVTWDPGTQTVLAERTDTNVILRIGDMQARINGQPTLMDIPALLVNGRTMVPLRFVSQALGSPVSWDASSATVQITSQTAVGVPPSQTYPVPPPPVAQPPVAPPLGPATTTVTGTVVSVNTGIYPGQLQVQVGNAVYTYKVVSTTAVTRVNVATNAGGSVALDAVRPGDQVQVTVDQSGTAQAIQVSYREVSGRVVAVSDANVVVLENGDTLRLNRSVQVDRNGTVVDASTLRPGDVVTIRVNPQTNEVWAVTIHQEAATPTSGLTSVNVTPSGRELRAADVVEVVATGTPAGRATFSIGGLRTGVPMVESTAQRGTYYGSYTIQPGDSIQRAEVTVRLTTPDGHVVTASAPTRIQINAAGAAPPTASTPTILSPANGSSIKSPFTVTGVARPGSQVKVTADYSGKVLLFFDVNGTLGNKVVTADQSGNWSAMFTQGPPVSGVTVTITAVAVEQDGRVISPVATVTTTLD
jgi:hypothetical protein